MIKNFLKKSRPTNEICRSIEKTLIQNYNYVEPPWLTEDEIIAIERYKKYDSDQIDLSNRDLELIEKKLSTAVDRNKSILSLWCEIDMLPRLQFKSQKKRASEEIKRLSQKLCLHIASIRKINNRPSLVVYEHLTR